MSGNELPNLQELSMKRNQHRNLKCSNPILINRELNIHHITIKEYYNDLVKNFIPINTTNATSNDFNLINFQNQPFINSQMRYLIFEFILCCHTRLKLSTTTLFQTFNIIDKFTSYYSIKNYNYQLVALTALWISSKLYDVKKKIPNLQLLKELCGSQYNSNHFIKMELIILKSLNWSISKIPTYDTFIDLILFNKISQLQQNVNNIKILTIMICELIYFEIEIAFNYDPNEIVNSVLQIVNIIESGGTKDFKNNKLTDKIFNYILSLENQLPSSFKLKYSNSSSKLTSTLYEKLIQCIKDYNEQERELAMNQYIGIVLDKQNPTIAISKSQSNSISSSSRDIRYSIPMTPTTPVNFRKRQVENETDETVSNASNAPSPPKKMRSEVQ